MDTLYLLDKLFVPDKKGIPSMVDKMDIAFVLGTLFKQDIISVLGKLDIVYQWGT